MNTDERRAMVASQINGLYGKTTLDRLVALKKEIEQIYEELYDTGGMTDAEIQELTAAVEREVARGN